MFEERDLSSGRFVLFVALGGVDGEDVSYLLGALVPAGLIVR